VRVSDVGLVLPGTLLTIPGKVLTATQPVPHDLTPGAEFEKRDDIWQPKMEPKMDYGAGAGVQLAYLATIFGVPSHMLGFDDRKKHAKPKVDTTRLEPFVGWKTLSIEVSRRGKLQFLGAGGKKYGVNAVAQCNLGARHSAPEWNCTCGFHALEKRPTYAEHGWFFANVELFGTVIGGELGWRASRQRILSMEVKRQCQHRSRYDEYEDGCGKLAVGFNVVDDKVGPVCARHGALGRTSLADLTAMLGTEVRWAT